MDNVRGAMVALTFAFVVDTVILILLAWGCCEWLARGKVELAAFCFAAVPGTLYIALWLHRLIQRHNH